MIFSDFTWIFWMFFKVTKVTTKSYLGYYWTPKRPKISSFLPKGKKCVGRSPPQELKVSPRSQGFIGNICQRRSSYCTVEILHPFMFKYLIILLWERQMLVWWCFKYSLDYTISPVSHYITACQTGAVLAREHLTQNSKICMCICSLVMFWVFCDIQN